MLTCMQGTAVRLAKTVLRAEIKGVWAVFISSVGGNAIANTINESKIVK